jgi:hypothetical protein
MQKGIGAECTALDIANAIDMKQLEFLAQRKLISKYEAVTG